MGPFGTTNKKRPISPLLKLEIVQFCFLVPVFCFALREKSVSQTKLEIGGFREGKIVKFVCFPAVKSI